MKKLLVVLVASLVLLSLVAIPALAGKHGPAGKSNVAHLYLYEKVPSEPWPIVPGGAWGKMNYKLSGSTFDFVFNGHGLDPNIDYSLIYYPDPWPGNGLICLGAGSANEGGNVHIMGAPDTGDLPAEGDTNRGAKIWLVLSDDVECGVRMTGWNPTEYLFEYDLITFEDTDV
ncbi:MAG TPA: hypothetical protein VMY98_00095 [Anaerolineae bacterium]|nr:hypothetical protein [Anaerolineae bacterium]